MSTTISSKLAALVTALLMNGLIMGGVGYLFEIQSHPHISVISFARQAIAVLVDLWMRPPPPAAAPAAIERQDYGFGRPGGRPMG
jgi:hypothetical protein